MYELNVIAVGYVTVCSSGSSICTIKGEGRK